MRNTASLLRAVAVSSVVIVCASLISATPALASVEMPTQAEWEPADDYQPPVLAGVDGSVPNLLAPVDALPAEGAADPVPEDSLQATVREEMLAILDEAAQRASAAVDPPELRVDPALSPPEIGALDDVSTGDEPADQVPEALAPQPAASAVPAPIATSSPAPGEPHDRLLPTSTDVSTYPAQQRMPLTVAQSTAVSNPAWCTSADGVWGFSLEDVKPITPVSNATQGVYSLTVQNRGSQAIPAGTVMRYRLFNGASQEQSPNNSAATLGASIAPGSSSTFWLYVSQLAPDQTWTLSLDMNVPGVGLLTDRQACAPNLRLEVLNQSPTGLKQLSPAVGATINVTRPTLKATATDPDKWPNAAVTYKFKICSNAALTTSCQESTERIADNWQVPNALNWGGHYWWKVTVSDGRIAVDSTSGYAPSDFYVIAPSIDDWRRVGAGLGVSSVDGLILPFGIFTSSAVDAKVYGAGQALSVDRIYASGADGVEGAFGRGWISIFDTRVVRTEGASGQIATVNFPDGRQESFGKNADGTWAAGGAVGATDQFAVDASGAMTVREASGTIDYFDSNGDLTRVSFGDSEWVLTRSGAGGNVTKITQMPSGRALDITWASNIASNCADVPKATRPHVSAIAVSGVPGSSWTYEYRCSRLVGVTNPEGGKATYATTAESFAGTTFGGAPLPGLRGYGPWDFYGSPTYNSRSAILTVPGSVDRVVTMKQSKIGQPETDYLNTINRFGGSTFTYCEYRSIANGAEACPLHETRILFDRFNRPVFKQVSAPNAPATESNSRYWMYSVLNGELMAFVDENSNVVSYTYDAYGNPQSSFVMRDANTQVTNQTFYRQPTTTDPQARVSGIAVAPTQPGTWRADMFTYDTQGRLLSRVGNPTPAAPSGEVKTYTYTGAGSSAYDPDGRAVGTAPSGLLATETSAGGVSTNQYAQNGDLARTTPVGAGTTSRTYDAYGQIATENVGGTGSAVGARTEFVRDKLGRVLEERAPCVLNVITEVQVRKVTTRSYNQDGLVTRFAERAVNCESQVAVGQDRGTTMEYDEIDRLIKTVGPTGDVVTYQYDAANPSQMTSMTDARGRRFEYSYSAFNGKIASETSDLDILGTRVRRITHSYQYDPGGRLIAEADAMGRVTAYSYTNDGLLKTKVQRGVGFPARDVETWRGTYDGNSNLTSVTVGGVRTTNYVYDSESRLQATIVDPAGLNRVTTLVRDPQGRVIGTTTSDGIRTETVSYGVDAAGNPISATVENGMTDISTRFERDGNGLLTSVTDPVAAGTINELAGSTLTTYDVLGRVIDVAQPQTNAARPSSTTSYTGLVHTATRAHEIRGYNAFGDVTETKNALGQITRMTYDAAGRILSATLPDYTPLGASSPVRGMTERTYSPVGDLLTETDRRGNTTRYAYDVSGNQVRIDVNVTGGTRTTVQAFTSANELRAITEPSGATTTFDYDALGRMVYSAKTQLESSCCTDGDVMATTYVDFNDAGDVTDTWIDGANAKNGAHTRYEYNAAGEMTAEWKPGVSNPTRFERDLGGRVTKQTTPDGVSVETTFDLAGRPVAIVRVGTDGVRTTTSQRFDAAGRIAAITKPNGGYQSWTYDFAGRVIELQDKLTTAVSRRTQLSYDVAGNLVRTEDARGNTTWNVYNSWGLLERVVEPITTSASTLFKRSWQFAYEPGGEIAREIAPGGVETVSTYDAVGQRVGLVATDPDRPAANVSHALTYSRAGALLSVDTPAGAQQFTWGSRGQMLTARGPVTNADYFYDDNMRISKEQTYPYEGRGAVGVTEYGYDSAGRLTGVSGLFSGRYQSTQRTFEDATGRPSVDTFRSNSASDWNGQPKSTGTTTYGYDAFGRQAAETLRDATGSLITETQYAFDSVDNMVSRTVSGTQVSDGGTYQYDLASRLVSWTPRTSSGDTADRGVITYTWDAANNRVGVRSATESQTWNFDQRNRPLSTTKTSTVSSASVVESISSNARGDLVAIGDRALMYNALGQLTGDGAVAYEYDGLGRLARRGTQQLLYRAQGTDPIGTVDVGGTGELTAPAMANAGALTWNLGTATSGSLMRNAHGDTVGRLDRSGVYGAAIGYDPFGARTSGSSQPGAVTYNGFQGDWTDPSSGAVYMGARWYDPVLGTFLTRDSIDLPVTSGGALNRYTYGESNPLNMIDPTGHAAIPYKPGIGGLIGGVIGGLFGGVGGVPLAGFTDSVAGAWSQFVTGLGRIGDSLAPVAQWMQESTAFMLTLPFRLGAEFAKFLKWAFASRIPNNNYINGGTSGGGTSAGGATQQGGASGGGGKSGTDNSPPPPPRPVPVDVTRGGWLWTQTQHALSGIVQSVSAPAVATSSTAGRCGLGGTLASCQTPSEGIGRFCASATAVASVCAAAEPTGGRPGGVRGALPMKNAKAGAGGSAALGSPDGGCSPAARILGVCRDEGAPRPPSTSGGSTPVRNGQQAEEAVRSTYNTGDKYATTVNGRSRIFDGLNREAVTEVKNVRYQWFSTQIRDSMQFASDKGIEFHLYIRQGGATRLSRPLQEAMESNPRFQVRFIP